jgi:hypothetical protein
MAHPLRFQRSRQKGWRKPPGSVIVTRPPKGRGTWGNPFKVPEDGTQAEVVAMFESWIQAQPHLLARLPELRGKQLGCWCKLDQPCHADVLARLANPT